MAITPTLSSRPERSGVERSAVFPHLAQRARQIWGTLDWWPFWIHTSSRSKGMKIGRGRLDWLLHLLCHLDRSEAEWRDLRFSHIWRKEGARYGAPIMIFDRAERSGVEMTNIDLLPADANLLPLDRIGVAAFNRKLQRKPFPCSRNLVMSCLVDHFSFMQVRGL